MARRANHEPVAWPARLQQEHAFIDRVLSAIDEMMVARPHPPLDFVTAAVEFLRGFVGECHERSEHEGLFPVLREWIGADAEPALATLEAEHGEERQRLAAIASTLRDPDAERGAPLAAYGTLLRGHLAHEMELLQAFAAVPLPAALEARIRKAYVTVERRSLGPGGVTAMHGLVDALEVAAKSAADARAPGRIRVARDLMRMRTGSVSPDASLSHALVQLTALGVRELPVVQAGALVGIVTVHDLEPHRGRLEWTPVRAAMSANPTTVAPDTPVAEVARVLTERGFNACPVVEGGIVRGMIARRDLLLALVDGECQ